MDMTRRISLLIGFGLLAHAAGAATQFLGGNGLFHTWTARTLEPGQLGVNWHSRMWSGSTAEGSISNVSQAVALSFGFSPHVELEITPMIYQDLNFSSRDFITYNAPDDVYLRMRFGNYQMRVADQPLSWALMGSVRTNSSKFSNVYLEPYNTTSNELSLGGAISWYANPLYPSEGASVHFNLGWTDHNDGGASALNIFSDVTNDLEYSLAYRNPGLRWELFAELYGNKFLKRPPVTAYTRADALWIQPGVSYRLFQGMSVTAGLDVRLMESGPELVILNGAALPAGVRAEQARKSEDYPEYYPDWRFALKVAFTPSTAFRHVDTFSEVKPESQKDYEMREKIGVTEREMIDWLGAEDQSAEFLDLELEKIRAERRNAEKELERLREKLKDDKSK